MPRFLINQKFLSAVVIMGLTGAMLLGYQNCGKTQFARMGSEEGTISCGNGDPSTCGGTSPLLIPQLTNGKGVVIDFNGGDTCPGLTQEDVAQGLHREVTIGLTALNFVPTGHYCLRLSPIVDGPGAALPAEPNFFNCEDQDFPIHADQPQSGWCHYEIVGSTRETVTITCSELPNENPNGYRLHIRGKGTGPDGEFYTEPPVFIRFTVNDCAGAPPSTTTTTTSTTTTTLSPSPNSLNIVGVGKPGIDDIYDDKLTHTDHNPAILVTNPFKSPDGIALDDYPFNVKVYAPIPENTDPPQFETPICAEDVLVSVNNVMNTVLLQTQNCPINSRFSLKDNYRLVVSTHSLNGQLLQNDPPFLFDVLGPLVGSFQVLGVSDEANQSPSTSVTAGREDIAVHFEFPGTSTVKIRVAGPVGPGLPLTDICPEQTFNVPTKGNSAVPVKCSNSFVADKSYYAYVNNGENTPAANSPYLFMARTDVNGIKITGVGSTDTDSTGAPLDSNYDDSILSIGRTPNFRVNHIGEDLTYDVVVENPMIQNSLPASCSYSVTVETGRRAFDMLPAPLACQLASVPHTVKITARKTSGTIINVLPHPYSFTVQSASSSCPVGSYESQDACEKASGSSCYEEFVCAKAPCCGWKVNSKSSK